VPHRDICLAIGSTCPADSMSAFTVIACARSFASSATASTLWTTLWRSPPTTLEFCDSLWISPLGDSQRIAARSCGPSPGRVRPGSPLLFHAVNDRFKRHLRRFSTASTSLDASHQPAADRAPRIRMVWTCVHRRRGSPVQMTPRRVLADAPCPMVEDVASRRRLIDAPSFRYATLPCLEETRL
jgi:hypothetical protein